MKISTVSMILAVLSSLLLTTAETSVQFKNPIKIKIDLPKLKLPTLPGKDAKPEGVEKYVDEQMQLKHGNPIPLIAEFAFYQKQKKIGSEKLAEAANKVAGQELALKFATATQDQILTAFDKSLPKEHRPKNK